MFITHTTDLVTMVSCVTLRCASASLSASRGQAPAVCMAFVESWLAARVFRSASRRTSSVFCRLGELSALLAAFVRLTLCLPSLGLLVCAECCSGDRSWGTELAGKGVRLPRSCPALFSSVLGSPMLHGCLWPRFASATVPAGR